MLVSESWNFAVLLHQTNGGGEERVGERERKRMFVSERKEKDEWICFFILSSLPSFSFPTVSRSVFSHPNQVCWTLNQKCEDEEEMCEERVVCRKGWMKLKNEWRKGNAAKNCFNSHLLVVTTCDFILSSLSLFLMSSSLADDIKEMKRERNGWRLKLKSDSLSVLWASFLYPVFPVWIISFDYSFPVFPPHSAPFCFLFWFIYPTTKLYSWNIGFPGVKWWGGRVISFLNFDHF